MGLMDMFSIRDIRSFGKGFLGARVEAMQESARVAAEQKKFQDELYANEASYIRKQNNKLKEENKIKLQNEEDDKDRRKQYLAAYLQVPESWVERHASIALEDSTMMKLWLDDQAKIYKRNDWYIAPIKFGKYEGMRVTDWMDQTGSGAFNNEKAGETVSKENLNGLDNTKNVVLDTKGTATTGYKKATDKSTTLDSNISLQGSQLFFAPASHLRSNGKYMVSEAFPKGVYTYRLSQTPGKDDWSDTMYHDAIEDGKIVTKILPTNGIIWHDITSNTGQKINQQAMKLFDSASLQEHMVKIKGKNYSFQTKNTKNTDNSIDQMIVRMDPDLAEILGIPLVDVALVGEPPAVASKTRKSVNELNIPLEWLIASADEQGINLNIRSFDSNEFFNSNKGLYVSQDFPKAGSTDRARLYTGFMQGAGFETRDKNNQNIYSGVENEITRTHSFNIYTDTDQGSAAASGIKILDNSLAMLYNLQRNIQVYDDQKAGQIPELIANELGIDRNAQLIDYADFTNSLSTYYANFRRIRGNQELTQLKHEQDNGTLETYLKNHEHGTGLKAETAVEELASSIVDRELATITTLDSLILSKLEIDKRVDKVIEEQKREAVLSEQQMFDNLFPPSEREIGNTLESFVDYFVGDSIEALNDEAQAELLQKNIEDITMNSAEANVIRERAKEYLEKKMANAIAAREEGDVVDLTKKLELEDKSEALLKKEVKTQEELTLIISDINGFINDLTTKINDMKSKSKETTMLPALLRPLEDQRRRYVEALVGYLQQQEIIDKGHSTDADVLIKQELEKFK